MDASVKRFREAEASYNDHGRDQALNAQMEVYDRYIAMLNQEAGKMETTARSMAEQLRIEREARDIERKGYQQQCRLSQEQARHFNDMCKASDMRIEELERNIHESARQAANERVQAQQFCQ